MYVIRKIIMQKSFLFSFAPNKKKSGEKKKRMRDGEKRVEVVVMLSTSMSHSPFILFTDSFYDENLWNAAMMMMLKYLMKNIKEKKILQHPFGISY